VATGSGRGGDDREAPTAGRGLDGATVAVIGLGASGRAAARLALEKGAEVYVSDQSVEAAAAAGGAELRSLGARVEGGGHDLHRVARSDLVVVSPGIPPDAPVLRELRARGVGWISEPELAVRFYRGPLIAITGTNGKTTTTVLTAHLLDEAGIRVAHGGNVGAGLAPAASELALRDPPPEWYVLELSSFQLGSIDTLRPDIGVLLNLSPDHLAHYGGSVEAYYADKARLFENADAESRWVLPLDAPEVEALARDVPGRRYRFALEDAPEAHAFVREGTLTLRTEGEAGAAAGGTGDARTTADEPLLPVAELPLLGRHNHLNALAAALTARLAGAAPEGLARGLRSAPSLPHRLTPVAEVGGVLWVDDSKATNVAATRSALASLDRPVVLLVGGTDKGEDFAPLRPSLGGVRRVLAYGEAAGRLARELEGGPAPIARVGGRLDQLVAEAARVARPGDVVLLSPACSSFDMFESYRERGERFQALVRERAR
jgi:UDP-N-acetylmuramoylalanine--D-glutamate ligase